ncbi:MAG: sulfotransferase family 2 domain-containing protein [Rhodobacteraceae bacterium]|uniref:sulfotransferase family 2 domain-containing protein n=1 Tax=Celeribacter sp. HF31 TaxID=2721558 RepID=UPI00142FE72C|nr:sulfotransferase family 2 domain-containing protein [Celeribacter sp. HF31]NIY80920.1 sulfotransferase family protein [Celeribacter sp. HF31]NVK45139.1 sulfotransferase family 2 domain-containing protein [Paracoccaceae bacterium]
MIVSKSKNLIYCRVPKSASTSVSAALEPYADPFPATGVARALRKIGLGGLHHRLFNFRNHSHLSFKAAEQILPSRFFDGALKFTVVRHPLSWSVSYYNHVLRDNLPPQYKEVFKEVRTAQSFDYFLDWLKDKPRRPISTQLIDEKGDYLTDHVVRCENLMAEASELLQGHGIQISVPRLNAGQYRELELSSSQREKIFDLYGDDMKAFGYDESGALSQPHLSATETTRAVAAQLGASGLAKYDCWNPF